MSAFYSYNFHIFRLFGFGKEEVDVYCFMSKQFIALFAGLLVLCSIQCISPLKMRGLILRRKTGTVSVKVFTFHVHLAFERHTGTEGREPLLSCSVYFVRIPLPFELIFFASMSKRLLFWCYSPCSEDSEKDSCSNKIKTTCYNWSLLFAAHQCRHWKRHSRLMKQIISSLQFFAMFSHL